MADSDEESERQRSRDKFRRERSEYDGRRRPGDKREPFDDRSGAICGGHGRLDHRMAPDLRSSAVDRGRSPIAEPPPYKRSRRGYDDYRGAASRRETKFNANTEDDGIYRPPLIPFKRFLDPMDDLITEEEACNKYKEYKESYAKRHIEEFFEAHKNEEWLRLRYHPDHMESRKEAVAANLNHRLTVFMDLLNKGFFDDQSVQMDNSENLIRLMDSVVIKLEGGTDEDLKALDTNSRNHYLDEDDEIPRTSSVSSNQACHLGSGHKSEEGEAESDVDAEDSDNDEVVDASNDHAELDGTKQVHNTSHSSDTHASRDSVHSDSSQHSKSCDGHSSEDDDHVQSRSTGGDEKSFVSDSQHSFDKHQKLLSPDAVDEDPPTPTTAEPPDGNATVGAINPCVLSTSPLNDVNQTKTSDTTTDQEHLPEINLSSEKCAKSYPLHKTASIFFRALPPSITESELKELCASQPGFLRLALWDPVPERRFMRHAWATYKPTVNIKKICWALNTSPLLREKITMPNGELGATVNRDLAQRVRPLTPLTRHKPIMRHDLMLAAQLIARLDSEHKLWESDDTGTNTTTSSGSEGPKATSTLLGLAIHSKNPLLKNLTDYLVEEGGSEEEALLAETNQNENDDGTESGSHKRPNPIVLESDPLLAKALDYLVLYLRVVHSVDFYAGTVYPMEHLMPHRCGILHARGDRGLNPTIPGGRAAGLLFSQREVDDHLRNFDQKLRALIDVPPNLTCDEMKKLGMRDPEKIAEEFVEANIQKRTGKKKPFKVVWVCPLSDKKFREPIFVRKHIFNKHMDKVEAAKKDNAIFFNNYLRDPRRPCLPEAPYHLVQQCYGSSGAGGGPYRTSRGMGRPHGVSGGGGYRGGYRNHNPSLLPTSGGTYSRGGGPFQDYYDVAAQQQHAMAAVAAAAAAALYPNAATAADLYNLTARPGVRRGQRTNSPSDYGSRSYDNRRRPNPTYNTNSRRQRTGERGMISYNDLDDPGNDGP